MFGEPLHSQFRFVLPKDFLLPDTREKFESFYRDAGVPYEDMIDYLNSTVVNSKLPGISDPGDLVQQQGERTRRHATTRLPEETLDKSLSIDFRLRESYLNWLMLYSNFNEYLDRRKDHKGRPFMPDVRLEILDSASNVLIEFVYKGIVLMELPALEFSKTDNGILTKDFTLDLAYNDFEVKYHLQKLVGSRSEKLHAYY